MSKIDFHRYAAEARKLKHVPLVFCAATNSLKIYSKRSTLGKSAYIWLDPQWELRRFGKSIISSTSYPYHKGPLYLQKHRQWCKRKTQLSGKVLLSVNLNKFSNTVFKFSGGYEIISYGYSHELIEEDYYGWYANAS